MFKYHGDKTEIMFKAWSEIWLTSSFKHWNIEYLLPSIDVPLLVIQGRDDQFGTVEQVNTITSKFGGTVNSKIIDNCAQRKKEY
jgi:pimeloyl-ACP methyl ester carboxylesterase